MKRMLINATQSEERRLAVVEGQTLVDYEVEIDGREQRKGNIYKGVVTRIEPSLEACFVDYGEERHGFLPFKEVGKEYFKTDIAPSQAKIQEVLESGQELLVQVEKEERGNKGAALTTFISLAGRYVVLMPNNPRGGGVSRRIEGAERAELKQAMSKLEYPKGMSVIARTAGIGRTTEELQWDLNYLNKLWSAVTSAAENLDGASLIYQESNLVIRALRDYFNPDIGEILVDTDDIYEQAYGFMSHVMSEQKDCVKRYQDATPLFSRFQIEHQIESAYARTVQLPSGGAIVIDHTEALVSVDVNSARAIRGGDIEETAFKTNIEAAREVARQARLRDLAGLIVIDFIDMDDSKNRREVESTLRDALRQDRARVQFGSISKFGLLEMSRQRLRPALSEGASIPCPRCGGAGHVRDIESSALQIMRVVQEESMKDGTAGVNVQVPVTVASFLLNEKREEITNIETSQRVAVQIIPNQNIETPNYRLERLKDDDARLDNGPSSYKLAEELPESPELERRSKEPTNRQKPVIKGVLPDVRKPVSSANKVSGQAQQTEQQDTVAAVATGAAGVGFLGWLKGLFGFGAASKTEAAQTTQTATTDEATERTANTSNKSGKNSGQRGQRQKGSNAKNRNRNQRSNRSAKGNNRNNTGRAKDSRDSKEATQETTKTSPNNAQRDEKQSRNQNERGGDNRKSRRGGRGGKNRNNERTQGNDDNRSQDELRSGNRGSRGGNRNAKKTTQRVENGIENANRPDDGVFTNRPNVATESTEKQISNKQEDRQGNKQNKGRAEAKGTTKGTTQKEQRGDKKQQVRSEQLAQPTQPDVANKGEKMDGVQQEHTSNTENAMVAGIATAAVAGAVALNQTATQEKVQAAVEQSKAQTETNIDTQTGGETVQNNAATGINASSDTPVDAKIVKESGQTKEQTEPLRKELPKVQAYSMQTEELQKVLEQSGLDWIHSDAERVAAIQAEIAAEPKPVHVPRERPPAPVLDDEPLVLVETRKELAQMQYPFST